MYHLNDFCETIKIGMIKDFFKAFFYKVLAIGRQKGKMKVLKNKNKKTE